jgi:hypothetical protein
MTPSNRDEIDYDAVMDADSSPIQPQARKRQCVQDGECKSDSDDISVDVLSSSNATTSFSNLLSSNDLAAIKSYAMSKQVKGDDFAQIEKFLKVWAV